jgi:hypothetical protein
MDNPEQKIRAVVVVLALLGFLASLFLSPHEEREEHQHSGEDVG